MRWLPFAAVVLPFALAGCAPRHAEAPAFPAVDAPSPSPIIVREFAFSPRVVTLDPTLGYSLAGGTAVPPRQRAEALGRAAAFNLADTLSREIKRLGYDVVAGGDGPLRPGERALIVTGEFRRIYEGHRHADADIAVTVAIDYASAGAAPQRLVAFDLDGRRLPREGLVAAAGPHGEDVNYEATRLGTVIGRYVARLAQTEHWPSS